MTDHRASMDYVLGVDDRQTTASVDALLAAANVLARSLRAKNGSDAEQLRGIRESLRRQITQQLRRAA